MSTESQFRDLCDRFSQFADKFSDLTEKQRSDLLNQHKEIERVSERLDRHMASQRVQLGHTADGGSRTMRDPHLAVDAGKAIKMIAGRDLDGLRAGHNASMSGETGAKGSALLSSHYVTELIRNVQRTGIFEANATVYPVPRQAGFRPKRTSGFDVTYPDIDTAPVASEATFGRVSYQTTAYNIRSDINRLFLAEASEIDVADLVNEEFAYSLRGATDRNGFIGDGTTAFGGTTGVLNHPDVPSVVADSGDTTHTELVAESTKYLAAMLGKVPDWADDDDLKFYGHRSWFFQYLGIKDSQNRPIADILFNADRPRRSLMSYPFETVPSMPAFEPTATTKALLLGNLRRGANIFRMNSGVSMRMSEHARFVDDVVVMILSVPQDISIVDANAFVTLEPASS